MLLKQPSNIEVTLRKTPHELKLLKEAGLNMIKDIESKEHKKAQHLTVRLIREMLGF